MDNYDLGDMVADYNNTVKEIEFIEVECEHARPVNPTEPENEPMEEWDDVETNNENPTLDINSNVVEPDTFISYVESFDDDGNEWSHHSSTNTDSDSINLASCGTLSFRLKIENLRKFVLREANVHSEPFRCRNIPFNLFVATKVFHMTPYLAVYLQRNEGDDALDILVSANISIVDQLSGDLKHVKSFDSHLFRSGQDWGFSEYISMRGLLKSPVLMLNNSILFDVAIKADPPSCYYNSRILTGYVGIKNQGATCYMNSLLEVLFFLTKFRTTCYRIPTEMDDRFSMPLALQKIFYRLQFSNESACTKDLTKSFGWSTVDALMQHDIQELMRVLIEKIECRMKNTLLQDTVPNMFQGKFISYVKCRDVEFSSQREEIFYDIQLSLENAKNVYESFDHYVSPEMMDDDNKYHAGTFGLQAAEKGTSFISLPPVLFLHLLRFQFDTLTNTAVKNNSFYEFYDTLDLSKYVLNENKPSKYSLFAVLAHSGNGSHGHYVAYINPSLNGKWVKFDDDIISKVCPSDAINANFGSKKEVDEWTRSLQLNAYMLVYIRDSDAHEIFAPVDPMYISEELMMAMKNDEETNDWDRLGYNTTAEVHVFLETHLESDIRFDASKLQQFYNCHNYLMPKFTVPREILITDFKDTLKTAFRLPDDNQLRIWPIRHSVDSLSYPIYIKGDEPLIKVLSDCNRDKYIYPFVIWLEIALPGFELSPFDMDNNVLIFYYYYCPSKSRPYYVGHQYHDKASRISELVSPLLKLMCWPHRDLNLYRVFGDYDIQDMVMANSLRNYVEVACIDYVMTIVFEPTDHDESVSKLHSIRSYYNDLQCRVNIAFRNDDNVKESHTSNISLNTTFPEMLNKLAIQLNYDPKKIQIFRNNFNERGDAIRSTCTDKLSDILSCVNQRNFYQHKRFFFYKLIQVNVIDIENKTQFTFRWLSIDLKHFEKYSIYITDDETIPGILQAAEKCITPNVEHGSGKLRLLRVSDNRIQVLNDRNDVNLYLNSKCGKYNYFRIEEIPKGDETPLTENELFIIVNHNCPTFKPKYAVAYGHSFIFKINKLETWKSIKDRLRLRLGLSESIWEGYESVAYSTDDDQILNFEDTKRINDYDSPLNSNFTIRLDFINKVNTKTESVSQNKFLEKALTITIND